MPDTNNQNPWKKLSSKLIYKNPWISVREDQVIRPNGTPGIYGVVSSKIAVGILALDQDNQIYLVGQYRYATECYSWEIIEGGSEEGEDPLDTAKRELQEEAGLEASDWQRIGGDIHLSNCFTSELGQLFLARNLKAVTAQPDDTEVLQIKRCSLSEAVNMAHSGQITDALSLIGLMWLDKKINGNAK